MDKYRILQIRKQYNRISHNSEDGAVEFWYARELMPLPGYERWENFDKSVRTMPGQRGIKPEELPPSEDIKKLERRVKSQEKNASSS